MRRTPICLSVLLFAVTSNLAAQTHNPKSSGAAAKPAATLEDTYWHLTQVGDTTVNAPAGPREPHFVLSSKLGRLTGAGGCNGLTGRYQITGDQLALQQVAYTMMPCKTGADTEKAFFAALNRVKSWKITGNQLELSDENGHMLAKLEARSRK
jgi:heat shock protein HslJ